MPKNSNARNSRNNSGNQRNSNAGIDDVVNENTHTSRRAELQEKTLEELREKYEQVYDVPANEELTEEQLVELIIAAKPHGEPPVDNTESFTIDEGGDEDEVYGNQDKDEEYAIPRQLRFTSDGKETDWKNHVIVRQVPTRVVEGESVELRGQASIQLYRVDTYKRMLANKYFSEAKMNVKVLHKP